MKAILVIDEMPECCFACPCYDRSDFADGCLVIGRRATNQPWEERAKWCPLKPMPEKYIEREIKIETERDVEVCTHGITLGRNLLIEELEK